MPKQIIPTSPKLKQIKISVTDFEYKKFLRAARKKGADTLTSWARETLRMGCKLDGVR